MQGQKSVYEEGFSVQGLIRLKVRLVWQGKQCLRSRSLFLAIDPTPYAMHPTLKPKQNPNP